jgi:enolase
MVCGGPSSADMVDLTVVSVSAWEALDSRGEPTVACRVSLASGATGRAIVPSGASLSLYETREIRDGEGRFSGRGTRRAVDNIQGLLAAAVRGIEADQTETIDAALVAADATADLGAVGSNAVLAVSVATALAAANARDEPLWRLFDDGDHPLLPMPMVQVLSGGIHAGWILDIQDVLVIPIGAASFAQALEWAAAVRTEMTRRARLRPFFHGLVGDEGGLGLDFGSNREAIEFVATGITDAGFRFDQVAIGIDVAAGQLRTPGGGYRLRAEGHEEASEKWAATLLEWARSLPIISIEDPVSEDDWTGWKAITKNLSHIQVVGDDVFATDDARVRKGITDRVANAVLVKPNQCGTLSRAWKVIGTAKEAGYSTIVSARSGDTEDTWLADLAVGWRAGQIKVGALSRSERTAKWNRLLEIEADGAGSTLAKWTHVVSVNG